MQNPSERSHGSGNRNANIGQTSDRQELPPEQRGDSRSAGNNDTRAARKPKSRAATAASGGPEADPQEMDAEDEARKIERLGRDPVEGPPSRK